MSLKMMLVYCDGDGCCFVVVVDDDDAADVDVILIDS
jgi:hypothetical protein